VGTIWRVGGLAPPNLGVSNGRGGLLGSGTNAPLYTTSFSAARAKAQEDLENHENRLAHALELDRVSRVLEFRDFSTSPQKHITLKEKQTEIESRTTWTGTEWVMGTTDHSMGIPPPCHFHNLVVCRTDCNRDTNNPRSTKSSYCSFQISLLPPSRFSY
jgi:meiosis-specific APC/C activator protein AMA1